MWEKIQNIVIILLAVAVIGVALYKFVFKKEDAALAALENSEKITVLDLANQPLKLTALIGDSGETWVFVLKIDDCHPCLRKALHEVSALNSAGAPCLLLIVHDNPSDIAKWAGANDIESCYVMSRVDFMRFVRTPFTPVRFKFQNGKPSGYMLFYPT